MKPSFSSPVRPTLLLLTLLLAIANSGCSGPSGTDTGVAEACAAAIPAETAIPSCDVDPSSIFAEITAPADHGIEEVAIAASSTHVAVAYTQWDEAPREVTVFVQRYLTDGTKQGDPVALGAFKEAHGQLASGDGFYGDVGVVALQDRFVACWSDGSQINCASLKNDSDAPQVHGLSQDTGSLTSSPRLIQGDNRLTVFCHLAALPSAIPIDEDGSPKAEAARTTGRLGAQVSGGFAAIEDHNVGRLQFLDHDFKPSGDAISILNRAADLAPFGDGAALLSWCPDSRVVVEQRVSPSGQIHNIPRAEVGWGSRLRLSPFKDGTLSAYTPSDGAIRLRFTDADGAVQPPLNAGCALPGSAPSIAAIPSGLLVAAPQAEGAHGVFYSTVVPTLRVLRVPAP